MIAQNMCKLLGTGDKYFVFGIQIDPCCQAGDFSYYVEC